MNNSLPYLNNVLFEQIERINDDDLTEEELKKTLKKADGVNRLASTIVKNTALQLKAYQEFGGRVEGGLQQTLGIED